MVLPENERQRIIIQRQIAEYLARGGEIQVIDHTANHHYQQPVKRNRKDQVAYMRRFGTVRGRRPHQTKTRRSDMAKQVIDIHGSPGIETITIESEDGRVSEQWSLMRSVGEANGVETHRVDVFRPGSEFFTIITDEKRSKGAPLDKAIEDGVERIKGAISKEMQRGRQPD